MSLGKKDIVKNITSKAQISNKIASSLLNKFIEIISNESRNRPVKISNFGTFYSHKSPKRIGRNPSTKEEFIIKERVKINFSSSRATKDLIN